MLFAIEDAFCNRGLAYGAMGNYVLAIEDFNRTLQLNPNYYGAYYGIGVVKMYQNQFKEAIIKFNKCIEINPLHVSSYFYRGYIYELGSYYNKALENYSAAIKIDAFHKEAHEKQGFIRIKIGDLEGGIQDLKLAANISLKQGNVEDYQRILNNIRELEI
ncbi:tetratricopeptide repeat protein [Nostoc sp.]|uniref:tetratricopeptide repeat protein n=1 Tax=Nostoc sp. TaxID=1180 RepID=UPI002FFC376F